MNNELKMFLRYGFSVLVAYGAGRGWFTPELGNEIIETAVKVVEIAAAFVPALYAAKKINNSPVK